MVYDRIMPTRKRAVTITLSERTIKKIDKLAKATGLSRSAFIEMVFTLSSTLETQISDGLKREIRKATEK